MKNKVLILRIEVLVLVILIGVLCTFLYWGKNDESSNAVADVNVSKETGIAETESKADQEEKDDKKDILKSEAKKIYENNKEILLLVNKNNKVPDNYDNHLIDICNGRLQASAFLYNDLKKMLNDADAKGYSFWIASAYRSKEKQQYLVNEDVEAFMNQGMRREQALEETLKETMPSGYSEHQTGLALDILTTGNMNMDRTQEDMEGNKWLRKHCKKYGFILRYPDDKEDVTLISYEPWHFRYVGKEAAEFIMEHNLTLEEFLELAR